jgi:hypothetical protein
MVATEPRKLSRPTQLLFHIAVRSHTLADYFGADLSDDETRLVFRQIERPWLTPHPALPEWTFDADRFAKKLGVCSTGEEQMVRWILNVWNPGYAKSKGWHFDLFKALDSLDQNNREAICWWLQNPIWP